MGADDKIEHARGPLVSVVVPVFNERKPLGPFCGELSDVLQGIDAELIFVDDASTDGSREYLEALPNITLVSNPANQGYGTSLKRGIERASADLLAIIDADGTYPVDALPALIDQASSADMVVGARTGSVVEDVVARRFGKWILKGLVRFLYGKSVPDLNSGLRVFHRSLVNECWNLLPAGFSFTSTLTLHALSTQRSVIWVPINYYKRRGSSSIRPVRHFLQFCLLILRIAILFGPVRFFAVPGFLCAAAGLGLAVAQLATVGDIGEGSLFLLIGGIQIGLMGVLAELIVRTRGR